MSIVPRGDAKRVKAAVSRSDPTCMAIRRTLGWVALVAASVATAAGCADDGGSSASAAAGGAPAPSASTSTPSEARVTHPVEPVGDAAEVQAELRNALAAALVAYTDEESFVKATPDLLARIEPSVAYGTIDEAGDAVVGVGAEDDRVVMLLRATDAEWFCIAHDVWGAGTTFGRGTDRAALDSPDECAQPSW